MKTESPLISIIIPNYNGSATIGKCLESAFSSKYPNFEIVVVDDCSTDDSVKIIKRFPCKLIQLDKRSGASKARNIGAQNSVGKVLFFIDADCLLQEDTLALVDMAIEKYSKENIPPPLPRTFTEVGGVVKGGVRGITIQKERGTIIGGTYTRIPYDNNFFSTFQSIFINYSETKNKEADYIATHAMIIDTQVFRDSGGFKEDLFLPILEDVEFSHRLRRAGYRLVIDPKILVRHIFNFSLFRSLLNAVKKSMYWTVYSIKNRDLLADSGTASVELKINVLSYFLSLLLLMLSLLSGRLFYVIPIPFIFGINISVNREFIKAFYETKGLPFTVAAVFYYLIVYPFWVGAGAFTGALIYLWLFKIRKGLK